MITTRLKMMLGTAMLVLASQHALAADPIRFALCVDMTKSYPFITVPYVQGVRDYAALINSKGGIESHRAVLRPRPVQARQRHLRSRDR